MDVVITDYLTDDARKIREEVFIKEQKFKNEFGDIDANAKHMVVYDEGEPIACCRFFKGESDGEYIIGRLAVLLEYRGMHSGSFMLDKAEEHIKKLGARKLSLSAQLRVEEFYKKHGYHRLGEIYFDEYCEHIHMEKDLT